MRLACALEINTDYPLPSNTTFLPPRTPIPLSPHTTYVRARWSPLYTEYNAIRLVTRIVMPGRDFGPSVTAPIMRGVGDVEFLRGGACSDVTIPDVEDTTFVYEGGTQPCPLQTCSRRAVCRPSAHRASFTNNFTTEFPNTGWTSNIDSHRETNLTDICPGTRS